MGSASKESRHEGQQRKRLKADSSSGSGGQSGEGAGAEQGWQDSDEEQESKDSGLRGVDVTANVIPEKANLPMIVKERKREKVEKRKRPNPLPSTCPWR